MATIYVRDKRDGQIGTMDDSELTPDFEVMDAQTAISQSRQMGQPQGSQPQQPQQGMEEPQEQGGLTKEGLTQAITAATQAGDFKAADNYAQIMGVLFPNGGSPIDAEKKKIDLEKAKLDLEAKKKPNMSADAKKQQAKLSTLAGNLKVLEENLGQVESRGKIGGTLGKLFAGATGGSINSETADYEALRKGLIGPVARAISGEVGVLTDRDIARAEQLLPKVDEDPKLAEEKLRNINKLVVEQGGKSFRKDQQIKSGGRNPIIDFLLGTSMNVAQDVGTGIRASQTGKTLNRNTQQAQTLENQSQNVQDPQVKKDLLRQATDIRTRTSQETGDISQSFSKDINDNPLLRALGSGAEIAATAEIPAAAKGLVKGAKAILHPFQTVGNIRNAKIAEAAGKTVEGDKIISGIEKAGQTLSPADKQGFNKFLDVAKAEYKGKQISIEDVVKINKEANKAYNASKQVGKSAKAAFNESLGKILKMELKDKAPEVSKANKLFETLYDTKKLGRSLVKPVATGAVTAYLLNKFGVGR